MSTAVIARKLGAIDCPAWTLSSLVSHSDLTVPSSGLPPLAIRSGLIEIEYVPDAGAAGLQPPPPVRTVAVLEVTNSVEAPRVTVRPTSWFTPQLLVESVRVVAPTVPIPVILLACTVCVGPAQMGSGPGAYVYGFSS